MKRKSFNTKRIGILFAVILLFSALLISVYYYSSRKELISAFQPPVPEADIPFDTYTVHPDSQLVIERPTGTRLILFPNSLVREDGKPIQGNIVVKVREFHSSSEILRAGIPMNVGNGNLESAGMIEVRAYNEEEELQLQKGQYMDVSLAGYKSSDGYQLYSFQQDKAWVTSDTFSALSNERKKIRLKELEMLASGVPSEEEEGDFIFELVMDTSESPHLAPFFGQQWKITDPVQRKSVQKALRVHWDEVEITEVNKKKMVYELKFSLTRYSESGKTPTRTYLVQATPVVDGKNKRQRRNNFNEQMTSYAAMLEKVKEEKARLAQQADLLNSFKMRELGICNIDRIMSIGEYVIRKLNFDFETSIDPKFSKLNLYVVFEENNTYFTYSRDSWDKIFLPKDKKVSLMAVLPNDEIAVIDTTRFQSRIQENNDILFLTTRRVNAAAYLKSLGTVPSVP